jgi:hypothetical protein
MVRGLFSQFRLGRKHFIIAVAILFLIVVGMVLVHDSLVISSLPKLDPVTHAEQLADSAHVISSDSLSVESMSAIRPADSYSTQLSLLEQRADEVSRFGQASSYALRLENLAQMGRAASAANHPPASANAYASYLDSLRRLGQAVNAKQSDSMDANGYSRWLDDLRHMANK